MLPGLMPAKRNMKEPQRNSQAAGEVLTAKQAPHRPGTAPALGLRAGKVGVSIKSQTAFTKET